MNISKIYYIHGTMYSGKSLDLISTYKTYEFHNKNIIVLKHIKDNRDEGIIKSRLSNEQVECITFTDDDDLTAIIRKEIVKNMLEIERGWTPDVVLIDEIQFASSNHIYSLHEISKYTPVMCYGLKTSYTGELFPSITKLIPLAENTREIKTTCCMCNSKATHNLLVRDNIPIYEGVFVNIEGANHNDKYHAVCREHFYKPIL